MKGKQIILNILLAVIAVVFLAYMFRIKGNYYQIRSGSGWFKANNKSEEIFNKVWVVASFVISSLPMLAVIIGSISRRAGSSIIWRLLTLKFCIFNIGFEILSIMGSGMCLDDTWSDIAGKMFVYQAVSLVPIVGILITTCVEHRKQEKSTREE